MIPGPVAVVVGAAICVATAEAGGVVVGAGVGCEQLGRSGIAGQAKELEKAASLRGQISRQRPRTKLDRPKNCAVSEMVEKKWLQNWYGGCQDSSSCLQM